MDLGRTFRFRFRADSPTDLKRWDLGEEEEEEEDKEERTLGEDEEKDEEEDEDDKHTLNSSWSSESSSSPSSTSYIVIDLPSQPWEVMYGPMFCVVIG